MKKLKFPPFLAGVIMLVFGLSATPARGAAGDFYVSDSVNQGSIFRVTPAGVKSLYLQLGTKTTGLSFDPSGYLFTKDADFNWIERINQNAAGGTFRSFATNLAGASLAVDRSGNVFTEESNGSIAKFDPAGVKRTFATGNSAIFDLVFDQRGNLYSCNGGIVYKFTLEGVRSTAATGFQVATLLATDRRCLPRGGHADCAEFLRD